MIVQPVKSSESVLGYTLRERIGGGGYGEVWVADAPGGLSKAVKIVYGYSDENRAQRELKALNRIKEVRHPFLLSLERIDIVKGRLIVVTELAEKSLKDRFCECIEGGMPGVPRDELLRYLMDAAEALDYLSEVHSLQHLDVKPENLLILGGHVKVADFGLVKDIHDGTQSLMAGLTPTYAPPELFDGRPSRFSDQYSLAIVFQEMLTGTRPYPGRTAAQLASQHLHGTPQLNALLAADQNVIRRALAKDPSVRFPDCKTLVEELSRRKVGTVRRTRVEVEDRRESMKKMDTPDATIVLNDENLAAVVANSVERKTPPAECDTSNAKFRPVLFVGIGQTGTIVMRQLKRRLMERLGAVDAWPALKILCIDTDANSLFAATAKGSANTLAPDEILPIPLRSSMDYRDSNNLRLGWLSRRWIYNIPRSQQTEGIRPLGRLAFVDHHQELFRRLEKAIESISRPEAVSQTAEATGLTFDESLVDPIVFVVASISGGVGSGTVPDMAYAIRTLLHERGLADDAVHGILLLTTGRSSSRRELSVANSFCCLSELNHYSQVSGYPGDESCGLPPFEHGPAYSSTYVVSMGDEPLPDEYETFTDSLAEYLYLNATTSCGTYLDACRERSDENDSKLQIRTLGLTHSGWSGGDLVTLPANVLCGSVLRRWTSTPGDHATLRREAEVALKDALVDFKLSPEGLMARLQEVLRYRLPNSPFDDVQKQVAHYCQKQSIESILADPDGTVQAVNRLIDEVLGINTADDRQRFQLRAKQVLDHGLSDFVHRVTEGVNERVLNCLNDTGWRFERAKILLGLLNDALQELNEQILVDMRETRDEVASLQENICLAGELKRTADKRSEMSHEDTVRGLINQHAQHRSHEFLINYAKRCLAFVCRHMDDLARQIHEIRQSISRTCDEFDQRFGEQERLAALGEHGESRLLSSLALRMIVSDVDLLSDELDVVFQRDWLSSRQGLGHIAQQASGDWRSTMAHSLYEHARRLVTDRLAMVDLDAWLTSAGIDDGRVGRWLTESLELAVPNLVNSCGGASRLLIAIPRGAHGARLSMVAEKQIADFPKILPATQGDVIFCYEVGEIPAPQVAARLMVNCADCAELVSRIHTRIDVNWTPIVKLT